MKAEASWRTVPALGAMSPEEAGAITALVKAGYAEYRERRMSPREAWEKSKGALEKVPEYFSPMILGSELCVVAKVRDSMEFRYKDPNTGADLKIAAVAGGELLKRGANSVRAFATHAVLSGPAYERIDKSALTEVYVTDTIPLDPAQEHLQGKFRVVSLADTFARMILRVYNYQPISSEFPL